MICVSILAERNRCLCHFERRENSTQDRRCRPFAPLRVTLGRGSYNCFRSRLKNMSLDPSPEAMPSAEGQTIRHFRDGVRKNFYWMLNPSIATSGFSPWVSASSSSIVIVRFSPGMSDTKLSLKMTGKIRSLLFIRTTFNLTMRAG